MMLEEDEQTRSKHFPTSVAWEGSTSFCYTEGVDQPPTTHKHKDLVETLN